MTIWMGILKRKLKDYRFLFMMSLFPILLTIIFVGMFTKVEELDQEISFSIAIEEEVKDERAQGLEAYFKAIEDTMAIQIVDKEAENIDFIIHVKADETNIEVENRGGNTIEESMLYTLLEQFNSNYALMQVVGMQSVSPFKLEVEGIEGYKEEDIALPIVVTMLIFGLLLGGNYGIKQVVYMRHAEGMRTLVAPISKKKLYFIEFMTSTFIIGGMGCIAAVVYEVLFSISFSKNVLLTLGMIGIVSMLATLLGMTIGINLETEDMGENILSLIITFSAVLSGGLMPMIELGKFTQLSPIKYLADAFGEIITTGQIVNSLPLGIILILCFAILIGFSALGLRRRENA